MDLQTALSQVNDFSRVLSLWDLLEEAGQIRALQSLESSTADYFRSSLVLIEREILGTRTGSIKQPTPYSAFLTEFRQLIDCQRGTINDFLRDKYSHFPSSHIQRKDISNEEAKAFLYCFKYLLDDNMEVLLQKVGEEALYYLLLNGIILVMIQGQYWQICGRSLELFFEDLRKGPKEDLVPQTSHHETLKAQAAKHDANQANKQKMPKIREYFKEFINRNHMFYCLHSNKKPTLFYKNPLTQRSREYAKLLPQEKSSPDSLRLLGGKLRLEIFRERPLHPSLVGAFDLAAGEWAAKFSRVDVAKIFKNCCKIDKSFFSLKDEIKRFIRLKEADDKKISEFLSKLVKLDATAPSVVRFVQVCVREMLPNKLLGSQNKEIIVASAGECVRLKKFETLSFREVYRKLKYNDIEWLRKPCHQKEVRAVVEENNLIFRQFLYFFFNKIVIELIRANFYATEKHNEHNKIFFYSKPVWYLITQTSMLNLAALNIEKLRPEDPRPEELKEPERERPPKGKGPKQNDMLDDFPCAKLRLVPKSDSVRPIMTFYKKFKDPKQNKLLKVGAYLKNAKIVLRGWRRILGETIGYAVFDNYQILDKYALYKKKWVENEKPSTYYSTMDIQKCYDSVNIELLFELLRKENIFKNFYLISEFFKVTRNRRYAFRKVAQTKEEAILKNQAKKTTKNKNGPKAHGASKMIDELSSLVERADPKFDLNSLFIFKQRNSAIPLHEANNVANMVQDEPQKEGFTIFLDRPRKRLVSKEDLLESIKFVCYQVRIKFGNQVYRLKKGLPQGLSISSVLSSFYYAVLEQRHLNSIYDGQRLGTNELIMRLTDDYLIMSPEEKRVREILDRLLECANKYGFSFNQKKLTTNFAYRDYDPVAASAAKPEEPSKEKRAKWIGKLIDLDSLEMEHVQVLDYRQIFYTISTNITFLDKFPAQIIKSKLKSFILNHNLFYLDARVNSKEKMTDILRKVIITSYLKTRTYLGKVLLNQKTGHERIMATKIVEALIDCSIAVVKLLEGNGPPKPLDQAVCREVYDLFYGTFLECLRIDQTSRSKRCLYWMLASQTPEARFDTWMHTHIDGLKLIF